MNEIFRMSMRKLNKNESIKLTNKNRIKKIQLDYQRAEVCIQKPLFK